MPALQSGGLALVSSNNIACGVHECLTDSAPYYEISFDAPTTKRPDEYHRLEIEIAKPGLTARTRQGYYAQPRPRDNVIPSEATRRPASWSHTARRPMALGRRATGRPKALGRRVRNLVVDSEEPSHEQSRSRGKQPVELR